MEDFYMYEDSAGGSSDGSGTIEIGGKPTKFSYSAYGACYRVNINGTMYPQFCGDGDDWQYANKMASGLGRVPSDDPSLLVAKRIEAAIRSPIENLDPDPISQIAKQMPSDTDLDDVDEFEEGPSEVPVLIHVVNGKNIRMPNHEEWHEHIQELPVTKNLQPRDRWGDEDPS